MILFLTAHEWDRVPVRRGQTGMASFCKAPPSARTAALRAFKMTARRGVRRRGARRREVRRRDVRRRGDEEGSQ